MDLQFSVRMDADVAVVSVRGEIDISNAFELRDFLLGVVVGGTYKVVVEMSGVAFLDSSGLSVLVALHQRADAHDGSLKLTGLTPPVQRVVELSGLGRMFPTFASVGEAINDTLSLL